MSVRGLSGRRTDPRLNARALNRRITLQGITTTPDGGGGYTETTVDLATNVPARVEPMDGNEQLRAMQTDMEHPHRFTIRYKDGYSTANRILYDERTFDVKSVVDTDERHRDLVILADEVE